MIAQSARPLGATQKRILQVILQANAPMRVEHLTRALNISRNATYQHVMALERDGFIERATITQTKGRPSQTYRLTEDGRAQFPKHYALFANLLIGLVKSKMGSSELQACLEELGGSLAEEFKDRVQGLEGQALFLEVATIMEELGYESHSIASALGGDDYEIQAHNCVFHELAKQHEEVCALDIALISQLIGKPVEQCECVVRGGSCCRFKIKQEQ